MVVSKTMPFSSGKIIPSQLIPGVITFVRDTLGVYFPDPLVVSMFRGAAVEVEIVAIAMIVLDAARLASNLAGTPHANAGIFVLASVIVSPLIGTDTFPVTVFRSHSRRT